MTQLDRAMVMLFLSGHSIPAIVEFVKVDSRKIETALRFYLVSRESNE